MQIIDKDTWPRREVYDFFCRDVPSLLCVDLPGGRDAPASLVQGTGAVLLYGHGVWRDQSHGTGWTPSFTRTGAGRSSGWTGWCPASPTCTRAAGSSISSPWRAGEDLEAFCRQAKARSAAQTAFITPPGPPGPPDELVYFFLPALVPADRRDQ